MPPEAGPTETGFFARADMVDTKVGQGKKDDAAEVARQGYEAMMKSEGDIITGWRNRVQVAMAAVSPAGGQSRQAGGARFGLTFPGT